jgi:hypothetical protein
MSLPNNIKTKWWIEITALALISALIYLISISHFSYYRDDWYYAYDSYIAGPSIFKIMFSSDRPARGLFFGVYYLLFGAHPLPYHIGAYVWRLLGSYSALWLFHLLWPRQRIANFSMALLFVAYPGFLWWPQGIEYQPMIASLCLHTFSIALTLAAIQSTNKAARISLWAGSILTGLSAIALVDYAIGMEAFRILCIFWLTSRTQPYLSFIHKVIQTIRASLISLISPLLFIVWKIFIFTGDRKATDISFQISDLLRAPLDTTLLWGGRLLTSALNVSVVAWWTPLKQYYPFLQQDDLRLGFIIATVSIALTVIAARLMADPEPDPLLEGQPEAISNSDSFPFSAIWLGLAGMVFGLLPVVMANRFVNFNAYSHYALPASLAAVILVVGLINILATKKLQLILVSLLIGSAALTHRGLAIKAANEQATVRDFWWQVYWRIPKIQEGTTLAAVYPGIDIGEDTDIVWGPANFLYYPRPEPGVDEVKYKLAGTQLDKTGIQNILGETEKISTTYRSHSMFLNYRRVLVMSQPSPRSCVHVIDERWPERSEYDTDQTVLMFPHSKIMVALTENESNSTPLGYVFGAEPAHAWCYYYQKAELARQQGDWETVAAIGTEVASQRLVPADPIEWMPFLQAYAALGQAEKLESLATHFQDNPFQDQQFCQVLNRMDESGYPLQPKMQSQVNDLFCK